MRPKFDVRNLNLWTSVYFSNYTCSTDLKDLGCDQQEIQETNANNLQKTRSCENLAAPSQEPISSPSRRKSDPSIILDNFDPIPLTKESKTSSNAGISNGTAHSEESNNDNELQNGMSEKDKNLDISKNGVISNGHSSDLEDDIACRKSDREDKDNSESHEDDISKNGHCNGNFHLEDDKTSSSANIECSTDTLTDGENKIEEKKEHHINGSRRPAQKLSLEKLVTLEKSASISTSTSDISNSNVDLKLPVDSLYSIHQYLCRSTPLRLTYNSNGFSQSKNSQKSSPTTPANSQSSTCPPTPATDKVCLGHCGNV